MIGPHPLSPFVPSLSKHTPFDRLRANGGFGPATTEIKSTSGPPRRLIAAPTIVPLEANHPSPFVPSLSKHVPVNAPRPIGDAPAPSPVIASAAKQSRAGPRRTGSLQYARNNRQGFRRMSSRHKTHPIPVPIAATPTTTPPKANHAPPFDLSLSNGMSRNPSTGKPGTNGMQGSITAPTGLRPTTCAA
jgi:hypothetical protein